jgi:hypothetical protein
MESEDESKGKELPADLKTISSRSSEDLIAGIPRSVSPSSIQPISIRCPSLTLPVFFAMCDCVSSGADHSRKRSTSHCQPPTAPMLLSATTDVDPKHYYFQNLSFLSFRCQKKKTPCFNLKFLLSTAFNQLLSPNPIDPITLPGSSSTGTL